MWTMRAAYPAAANLGRPISGACPEMAATRTFVLSEAPSGGKRQKGDNRDEILEFQHQGSPIKCMWDKTHRLRPKFGDFVGLVRKPTTFNG
jgi:hypothetical protein